MEKAPEKAVEQKPKHEFDVIRVGFYSFVFFLLSFGASNLIPERVHEFIYSAGMSVVQPVLGFTNSKSKVVVVDISALVGKDDKLNRKALTKLIDSISQHRPAAIGIDNDFTVEGQSAPPGQTALLYKCLALSKKGMHMAVGVDSPGMEAADRLLIDEFVPLQASLSVGKHIHNDEASGKFVGPHWIPVIHRITHESESGDSTAATIEELPSMSAVLSGVKIPESIDQTGLASSWTLVKDGPVETVEALVDLSIVKYLKDHALECSANGELVFKPKNSMRLERELSEVFSGKSVVLATIKKAQTHDHFAVPGVGREVPGGLIHAAAAHSLSSYSPAEITPKGTLWFDGVLSVLLGILVELLYFRFGSSDLKGEFRVDISWTLAVFVILVIIGLFLSAKFRIFWFEWLSFGLGQVMALMIKWASRFFVPWLSPNAASFFSYFFLGRNKNDPR